MYSKNLKFIFFGTPDVASKTLEILKKNGYVPEIIITSPDTKKGRGLIMSETPVSLWARENNIVCLKPDKIDENFIKELSLSPADLYVVVAYGKILPENLINIPELGTVNVHYSLLPLYRGASPIEACLLNGDEKTGISIQQMEYKLDSGPILVKEELGVGIEETKNELKSELINLGANCLCDILPKLKSKTIIPKPQDEMIATYCKKIKKEDGEIDINGNPINNWNKYRAFLGWPGVFFYKEKDGKKIRIKISEAEYKDNKFIIKKIIQEGKKETIYNN